MTLCLGPVLLTVHVSCNIMSALAVLLSTSNGVSANTYGTHGGFEVLEGESAVGHHLAELAYNEQQVGIFLQGALIVGVFLRHPLVIVSFDIAVFGTPRIAGYHH